MISSMLCIERLYGALRRPCGFSFGRTKEMVMADNKRGSDDKIQGEGNYDAARKFDAEERAFIARGEVDRKAREACW